MATPYKNNLCGITSRVRELTPHTPESCHSEGLIQALDWDTEFFGFGVARILPTKMDKAELRAVLSDLRRQKISLAYWASDCNSAGSKEAGLSAGGVLVDRKVTYLLELKNAVSGETGTSHEIREYASRQCNETLEGLAIASGAHSRFRVDPRIPEERYEELFRIWMRRSVAREMADTVLVAHNDRNDVVGVVTVGTAGNRGALGLLAVAPECQGKGRGKALVRAANRELMSRRHDAAQIVTQGSNSAGCRLFESAGYETEKAQNVFHFWLDQIR